MHHHKFDTVICEAEQQRIKRRPPALSDDETDVLIQRVIYRRCECGEIQQEKLEYPLGQEPAVAETTAQPRKITP